MTIKELFGHAIGVAKFPDFAKFYNWLTKQDHTFKGDVTFDGGVDLTNATVTGLTPSDTRPYKVYTAYVTLTGSSITTFKIYENTFGPLTVSAAEGKVSFINPDGPFSGGIDKLSAFVSNTTSGAIMVSCTKTHGGPPFLIDRIHVDIREIDFVGETYIRTNGSFDIEIRVYN